jgi:hypothetical protein
MGGQGSEHAWGCVIEWRVKGKGRVLSKVAILGGSWQVLEEFADWGVCLGVWVSGRTWPVEASGPYNNIRLNRFFLAQCGRYCQHCAKCSCVADAVLDGARDRG